MPWNGVMRSNYRESAAFSVSAGVFIIRKRIKSNKLIAKIRHPKRTACYKRIRIARYERIAGLGKLRRRYRIRRSVWKHPAVEISRCDVLGVYDRHIHA